MGTGSSCSRSRAGASSRVYTTSQRSKRLVMLEPRYKDAQRQRRFLIGSEDSLFLHVGGTTCRDVSISSLCMCCLPPHWQKTS